MPRPPASTLSFDAPVSLSLKREPTRFSIENKWSPFASPPDAVKAPGGRVVDGDDDPGRRGLVARRIITGPAVDEIGAATAFDDIVAAATKQRMWHAGIVEYVLCREVPSVGQGPIL